MFKSYFEYRKIRNHSYGQNHHGVWEHARKHRHLSYRESLSFRRWRPVTDCAAVKTAAYLNEMQLHVKQNLHDIPWTLIKIGAKG